MKSDALSKIFELPFCDEFKEVQLKIIDSPSINGNSVKTQRFDKNTILGFGPGTLFLYQINTIDFKTFDLRYHYEFSKGKTYYRGHDLSQLNDEQIEKIKEMINYSGLGFSMMPNYIENRIIDFKRENAAQKMFKSTVVLDADKKPFAPETVKEDTSDIANQKLNAENFDEVMAARTKTTFPNMFEPYEEIPVSTHGQSITFDDLGNPILNYNNGNKVYFGEPKPFNLNATQEAIYNKIKNMTNNMENNMENTKIISYQEFLNTPGASLISMESFVKEYKNIEEWMNSNKDLNYNEFMNKKMWNEWNLSNEDKNVNEDKSYNKISIEMERIESVLESCDGLDDEQILLLKEKIKNFENKLKDKVKPKTITISSVVHNKIKNYCNTFGLKIGDWVEETLLNALDCTDKKPLKPQTQEEWLEESREELLRKWRESQKINKLIKTDFLILKPKFKFKGFSILDHKPMYDYLGTDKELQLDLESIKCKVYLTTDKRELDNLTYLNEFADMPVEGFDLNLPEEAVDLEKLTSDGFKKLISILSGKK
jgi:hypothetical protein